MNHIPKGDFACPNCREEKTVKSSGRRTLTKTSSTRSLRSQASNDEEVPAVISRPVAQLIDGMSNFFLPKKNKLTNSQRQQSVQKAMNILRNKTIKSSKKNILKRLHTRLQPETKNGKKSQLLARNILSASKKSRIRRKPLNLFDETPAE